MRSLGLNLVNKIYVKSQSSNDHEVKPTSKVQRRSLLVKRKLDFFNICLERGGEVETKALQ